MKNLNKLLTLVLFIGTSYFYQAQSLITTVNTSSPNSCDGYAFLTDSSAYSTWTWIYSDSNTVIQENGILINLCPGDYALELTVNGVTQIYTFVITNGDSNPCSAFYAYASTTNPTGSNSCDGGASAYAYGGEAPYSFTWNDGQNSQFVSGLCAGNYSFTAIDAVGCSYSSYFYVGMNIDSTNINYNLDAYVYSGSTSADGNCDAYVFVAVYGGQAPYTLFHSDGQIGEEISGLCSGIYSVLITDAAGDSLIVNYIITNPSDIYNGGNYNDSTIVDSLTYDIIEDCTIDFSTLDSAFISNLIYHSNDSIQVVWSVIDANGTNQFFQNYSITNGVGVYELLLQIFCPQRSGSEFVYAKDRIYFNPALLNTKQINDTQLSVYPNPFQDFITIDLKEKSIVTISDLSGKTIKTLSGNDNILVINTLGLAKGNYLLTISTKNSKVTKLITK